MLLSRTAVWLSLVAVLPAQGPALADLKRNLIASDADGRRASAEALAKLGAAALPAAAALAAAMADKDATVADAAGHALGAIGGKAIPMIKDALGDTKRQLHAVAGVETLGAAGAELMPAVIRILRKEDTQTGDAVAKCACAVGAPAVPHLAKALKERVYAPYVARVLGKMGSAAGAALPDLMTLAENKTELSGSRSAALSAISAIREGAETYVPRILAIGRSDPDDSIRVNAISSLLGIEVRDPAHREVLAALTKDRNADVAQRARSVLEAKETEKKEKPKEK